MFKRSNSCIRHECNAPIDDLEHSLFQCDRSWSQRRILEINLEGGLVLEWVIGYMLQSYNKLNAINE
ncbi:Retrovirus-related Pol polyprotein from type-1 retrotransposable element R1 2 [Aphis craccivora]|uniref:Retrovirus-related Pol polyprotein from type-1 retrotransposable element R1 2 n=1 Tax=Aphis craccivora TaxID=307492 RepID=A0A6G0ZGY9_APHCR|nr:Retrovirus-related Pol polyprotein from type-1 retrotransposable element R1 2 [Aphis craccivora]